MCSCITVMNEGIGVSDRQEQIALLALLRVKGVDWNFIAREAQRPDGLERLLSKQATEASAEAKESLAALRAIRDWQPIHDEVDTMLRGADNEGVRLATVLDESYPTNLRTIFNLPPFLFYRGELLADDVRAVAVVGTRKATPKGIERAAQMARLLTENGVTVLSGLAAGVDTSAHRACLEAGGRTVAVIGTGIRKVYPAANRELSETIASKGAVVSQFWPDSPPATWSFPRRNVVMSGMGQGTVVIEASETSGAKMQARLALQHGKHVWLLRSLVEQYSWARTYTERGAKVVESVEDIVNDLRSPEFIRERANTRMQLSLAV
jgi:DNA processing protein